MQTVTLQGVKATLEEQARRVNEDTTQLAALKIQVRQECEGFNELKERRVRVRKREVLKGL